MNAKERFIRIGPDSPWSCITCAALVDDREVHHQWHLQLMPEPLIARFEMMTNKQLADEFSTADAAKLIEQEYADKRNEDFKAAFDAPTEIGPVLVGSGVDALLDPVCKCSHKRSEHNEHGICARTPSGIRCNCKGYEVKT